MTRMKTTLIHAALFVAVLLTPLAATGADEKLTPAEAKEIAKEAFLWGMHPVAIYHLRFNFAQNELNPRAAGINRLSWFREPMKALPRVATTPNATTLYGVGMFDLSKEPAVIIVPEIKDHYWSVHLHDNYSRWWHMIGSQFNAPGPVRRLLIGPNWSGKLPDGFVGADIVQSQSDFAGVLARVALPDVTEEEVRNVNAIQDRITAMSLSQWIAAGRKEVRAEDVPLTKADYPTYPGMEKVQEAGKLTGVDFLRWVSLVLNDPSFTKQTDSHREVTAFARFERLGLKAGTPFDPAGLTPEIAAAVEAGIEEGKKEVLEGMAANFTEGRNGWKFDNDLGYKDTNWQWRAWAGLQAVLAPVPSRSHTSANCWDDSEWPAALGRAPLHDHLRPERHASGHRVLGNAALRYRGLFLRQPDRPLFAQQLHARARQAPHRGRQAGDLCPARRADGPETAPELAARTKGRASASPPVSTAPPRR